MGSHMSEPPETVPSVRGTLFAGALERIRSLLDRGALSRGELQAALREDLDALDEAVDPSGWYSFGVFASLVELQWELVGERAPEFMIAAGRRTAARLMDAGAYVALQARPQHWGTNLAHVLTSVSRRLCNFTDWRAVLSSDPARFTIEVGGVAQWPESLRYASEGFIACVSRRASGAERVRVTSSRPTPDRVVFQVENQYAGAGGDGRRL